MLRLGLPFVAFIVILLWWLADAEPVPRCTSEGAELPGDAPEAAAVPAAEADPLEVAASAASPSGQGRTTERPSLEGTVTDPDGRGVEGVALRALFQRHGSSSYKHYCGVDASLTDRAGQFRMEVPFTAEWATLWIDAPGWVRPPPRAVGPEVYDVLDKRVGWSRQRIVLERGVPVEGVVEAATGVPLPDVQIEATWGDSRAGRSLCRTDARGRFSIVVPAKAVLVARAHRADLVTPDEGPGFPWEAVPRRFTAILTHDAEAWAGPVEPGSSNVRLVLRDVLPLRMRVRGPSGAISGYVVLRVTDLAWPALGSFVCEPYVREGEDLIEVPGLMQGTYEVEVLPKHQEWLPARALATLPGEPIDVRCEQALSIEGLLEGEDLKGFEITWTGPCNEGFENDAQRGRTLRVKTATFVLRGIGDGVGDVYARRAGDSRFAFAPAVRPGPGVLRLTLSKGRAITGRVEASAGRKPALDVRAVSGLLEQRARVRSDGTFSIVGLPPGTFRVELVTRAWRAARSPRGGRVSGEWIDKWLHDVRDDVPAGTEGVRLGVRLPAPGPAPRGS